MPRKNKETQGCVGITGRARDCVETIRRTKEQGLDLTGPDGLLRQFTRIVPETALNEEMTEHLGDKLRIGRIGQWLDDGPRLRVGKHQPHRLV